MGTFIHAFYSLSYLGVFFSLFNPVSWVGLERIKTFLVVMILCLMPILRGCYRYLQNYTQFVQNYTELASVHSGQHSTNHNCKITSNHTLILDLTKTLEMTFLFIETEIWSSWRLLVLTMPVLYKRRFPIGFSTHTYTHLIIPLARR